MESIRRVQKTYGSRAMVAAILIGLALLLAGCKPSAKGLILGTLFSVINFVVMAETLPLRTGRTRKNAFWVALSSIALRYALMAIPLVVAIKSPAFNLFAVIPGLLMVQGVILADRVFLSGRWDRAAG